MARQQAKTLRAAALLVIVILERNGLERNGLAITPACRDDCHERP